MVFHSQNVILPEKLKKRRKDAPEASLINKLDLLKSTVVDKMKHKNNKLSAFRWWYPTLYTITWEYLINLNLSSAPISKEQLPFFKIRTQLLKCWRCNFILHLLIRFNKRTLADEVKFLVSAARLTRRLIYNGNRAFFFGRRWINSISIVEFFSTFDFS